MPSREAISHQALHHLTRHRFRFELCQQGLDAKQACQRQQKHQHHHPKRCALERLRANVDDLKDNQKTGTADAQPSHDRKQPPRNRPGDGSVGQRREQRRRNDSADGPKRADPQGQRKEVERPSDLVHGSDVLDVENFVFAHATWRLNFCNVTRVLADQCARNRR